jgi:ABC-type multidrug transport system fused ATPase/permease subunit
MDITFVWLHPYMIGKVIKSIESLDVGLIQRSLIYYIIMWVGLLFLNLLEDVANLYTVETMRKNIKRSLLNRIIRSSAAQFKGTMGNVIISKINDVTEGSITIAKNLIINSIIFIFTQVIVFTTLYKANPLLFYVSFCATLFFLVVMFLINKHLKPHILMLSNCQTEVLKKMTDDMENIYEIKNFGNENVEKAILSTSIKEVYNKTKELTFLKSKVKFTRDLSSMTLIFVNVAILFFLRVKEGIETEKIISIISMTVAMMQFNRDFIKNFMESVDIYNISQSNLDFIVQPPEVQNKDNAVDLEKKERKLSGKIEFKSVDFSYKTKVEKEGDGEITEEIIAKNIFDGLSTVIESGSKIGITGASGSGKTTFVNLIMRYFDIDGGYIIFDDKYDIRDITQESLRKNITYLKHDTGLFARSIRENINYGKLDATDEEVVAAVAKSGCLDFIMNLPDKFDTIVGEGGVDLPFEKEKQIIIARMILRDSPIIIFDNFFHNIDNLTEAKIMAALDDLIRDKTVITITHDLLILNNMDMILVFDNGKIVETGAHEELIKKKYTDENGEKMNGRYRQMWESQIKETEKSGSITNKIIDTFRNFVKTK